MEELTLLEEDLRIKLETVAAREVSIAKSESELVYKWTSVRRR
jgi:hypothetical protein